MGFVFELIQRRFDACFSPKVWRGWTFYRANSSHFQHKKPKSCSLKERALYLLGGRHLRKSCLPSYSHVCPSSEFALTPGRAQSQPEIVCAMEKPDLGKCGVGESERNLKRLSFLTRKSLLYSYLSGLLVLRKRYPGYLYRPQRRLTEPLQSQAGGYNKHPTGIRPRVAG